MKFDWYHVWLLVLCFSIALGKYFEHAERIARIENGCVEETAK